LYRRAHGNGLDGIGGLYAEGRWHRRGSPIVYFGSNASIVVLERLAHLDPEVLPDDLILGQFAANVSVERVAATVDIHDLAQTQARGEAFVKSGAACVLIVPSIVVPEETNLVLNPLHPEAKSLELVGEREFRFDSRLL
jgi:RES domain-containing protein